MPPSAAQGHGVCLSTQEDTITSKTHWVQVMLEQLRFIGVVFCSKNEENESTQLLFIIPLQWLCPNLCYISSDKISMEPTLNALTDLDISLSSLRPSDLQGFLSCHQTSWLIPPLQINLDIGCVWCVTTSLCVFQPETGRLSVTEAEPGSSEIYSLVRSSFPRVRSSRPSTSRQGAKPLLCFTQWFNLSTGER